MRHLVARLLSPAMVVAISAFVVVLGSAGYAAGQVTTAASPGALAGGKTQAGVWAVDGFAGGAGRLVGASAVSFAFPLASAPKAHYVTSRPTRACPGRAASPSAAPGNLCVYLTTGKGVGGVTIYRETDTGQGASRIGFAVVVTSRTRGSVYAFGSWAVRAPIARSAAHSGTR
jgi:hypothetical protein